MRFETAEGGAVEQARARTIMWLGCGGLLCAALACAGAVALAIAAGAHGVFELYVAAAVLGGIGLVGGVASSAVNMFGFIRYLMARMRTP